MDVYHILYTQPIRASMGSPASSHTAGSLSLAGGHALGAHRDPLKLEPSRQRYAKHNDRCPAIGCTRPYPRDGIGVSPQMHEHTICMRSPLVLQLSLMNITPCHVSYLHVILIFISLRIIHIPKGVMFSCSLPYFMSHNSCSYIQIFIQTCHNRSRTTYRHMHNISHQTKQHT